MDEAVITMSREEIVEILEKEALRRLGMTAAEMFRRYSHGELEDPGDVSDLVILSRLLSEDDPLFAAA